MTEHDRTMKNIGNRFVREQAKEVLITKSEYTNLRVMQLNLQDKTQQLETLTRKSAKAMEH